MLEKKTYFCKPGFDPVSIKGSRTTKQDNRPRNFQSKKSRNVSNINDDNICNSQAYATNSSKPTYSKDIKFSEEKNNNVVNPIESPENKIISQQTPVSKALEYGSSMINTYKAPVDKAVESSSNMLSSGIVSFTNRVTKFPVIEQYVPWLAEEEE